MRLDILNNGYGLGTRLLFALIRLFSGHPVPDAAKLVFYRPDFYGALAKELTHGRDRPRKWRSPPSGSHSPDAAPCSPHAAA